MRQLATIQEISAVHPITDKDRIALAEVLGWQVIVQKSEFEVGTNCVFCEIESVLPPKPEFAFLARNNYRIKTMKMAGVVSQGICFPLSILPQDREYNVGDDVTDVIGVKQYEATMDKELDRLKVNAPIKHYPNFLMRFAWFRKLALPKKRDKGFPTFMIHCVRELCLGRWMVSRVLKL